eukprot:718358-Rhodomonas_salina.5
MMHLYRTLCSNLYQSAQLVDIVTKPLHWYCFSYEATIIREAISIASISNTSISTYYNGNRKRRNGRFGLAALGERTRLPTFGSLKG